MQLALTLLEIGSAVLAVIALILAWRATHTDLSEASDERDNIADTQARIKAAEVLADQLHDQGELLRDKGRDNEAKEVFGQRNDQYALISRLKKSQEQPQESEAEEMVTVSRRALNRAIVAAFFGTGSAVSGATAGALGANQPSPPAPATQSPSPSPKPSR